jgi:hypothetical protein
LRDAGARDGHECENENERSGANSRFVAAGHERKPFK